MLSRQILRLSTSNSQRIPVSISVSNLRGYSSKAFELLKSGQTIDPHSQSIQAGYDARKFSDRRGPYDAAGAHEDDQKSSGFSGYKGNREQVGFAEQVGSASAAASKDTHQTSEQEGMTGEERITPPSFTDAVKKKLGFRTTSGEDKQNRGGGEGVTGTGIPRFDSGKRTFTTSAVARGGDKTTTGQAPTKSREPKEKTNASQNPHLKHRSSSGASGGKSGKGNAAANPTLPSHQFDDPPKKHSSPQKRSLFTSATLLKDKPSAEDYNKDVDNNPPPSSKAHQVDGGNTGAHVQTPSGPFSEAGTMSEEYQTVDKEHPYDVPPSDKDVKQQTLRYGGKPNLNSPEKNVSQAGEGPEGKAKGGRKPEGSD